MKNNNLKNDKKSSRRNFLQLVGLISGGTILGTAFSPIIIKVQDNFKKEYKLKKVDHTRLMLGTFVQIVIFDTSINKAETIINKTYDEIVRLDGIFNRFSTSSAIGVLNDNGSLNNPPLDLIRILDFSSRINQISNGVHDITILPLLKQIKESFKKTNTTPLNYEISQAKSLVGFNFLNKNKNKISFKRDGMSITLDGIAKGYIVDRAMELIYNSGIKHALINAGGDLKIIGNCNNELLDESGWKIGIQDPYNSRNILCSFNICNNGAIATSGNYCSFLDTNKLYGHILHPYYPIKQLECISSTVLAKSCMVAETFAVSGVALGLKNARYLADYYGLGGLWLNRNGKFIKTTKTKLI